jgi:maltose O-acetyltransferase
MMIRQTSCVTWMNAGSDQTRWCEGTPREEMTEKSEKLKMLAGELYRSSAAELRVDRRRARVMLTRYNAISDGEPELLLSLLRDFMGAVGEGTVIMPTFTCDYGYNISLGRNVFINYHCIFLDCAPIEVGDDVQIGPAVQLYTAQHPLDADLRRSGLESARPIRIGNDVWIGGGAVVLPGVTIGERSIVGAGSVVVHSVPPDSVVVGNPARIVRTLV